MNKFVLLAGLPRTGSTLLANILAQNDTFYLEGNSGLCQLMWDVKVSCDTKCIEQLAAGNKLDEVKTNIISELPNLYYKGVTDKVIFDKCRPWVMPANMDLAKTYISEDIKTIVLVRPVDQIIRSFAKLNDSPDDEDKMYNDLMNDKSEVVMRSFRGTYHAAKNLENCLFVSYDNIVDNTSETLSAIYQFIGEDNFIHDIEKISQVISENEFVYKNEDLHTIRGTISRESNKVELPEWVEEKCGIMTKLLYMELGGIEDGPLCRIE